jgi:DNA-binding CsgD family transcriptional regulator
MLPALSVEAYFTNYFPFIAYIIVLLVIYRLNRVINKTLLVYLGISLLGLAFISFALLNRNTSGYLMTIGLMESSFALIDIFLWTTLCVLAFVYGAPFQIFGIILGANTASILFGDVIGMRLVNIEENNYLITALLSATSILLAIIVIPWLTKSLDYNSGLVLQSVDSQKTKQIDTPHDILMAYLPTGKALTDRETEVIRLTLQGMTNKDMARQLFISEHTVKSHLKNICNKFGVTRKKELLHLATRKEKE